MIYAVISTIIACHFINGYRQMSLGEYSPYGKILKSGFGAYAVVVSLIYCFVQASGAEEILFRGLIAKRMFSYLGRTKGNFVQALIFWLMHLVLVRLVTGAWLSPIQFFAFVTSFGLGLILGFTNFRNNGESIAPSWILHGSVNFISFLTLSYF